MPRSGKSVTVVVLGDLGRSPRMQYHALALAAEGVEVDLVGYRGSELPAAFAGNEHVRVHLLPPPRSLDPGRGALVLVDAVARSAGQTWRLLRLLLWSVRRPAVVLVQTPPPVPTLAVAWVASRLRSARFLVDWHNFGFTLLALKLGDRHPLVRTMAWYERLLGRRADASFSVSRAMLEELRDRWRIRPVHVLYDRPAEHFEATPAFGRGTFLRHLEPRLDCPDLLGPGRPAVVVSPTSWTPDEDFSLLLEAATVYEAAAGEEPERLPRLLIVATGKGPLREHFEARFRELRLRWVLLRTLWLSPDDYARFLGSADLGLSFHRSSSGFDLPMKIADMFGAGLPVCAVDYGPVVAEQVRRGDNGLLFTTGAGLGRQLAELFESFPESPQVARLREGARRAAGKTWRDGWREEALPALRRFLP